MCYLLRCYRETTSLGSQKDGRYQKLHVACKSRSENKTKSYLLRVKVKVKIKL